MPTFFVCPVHLALKKNVTCPDTQVVFICHDAGESLGLLPVAIALSNGTTKSQIPIRVAVLALGNPASTTFSPYPFTVGLESFGINVTIIDRTVRNQSLPSADVAMIAHCMGGIRVVVVGMVYTMQAQLAAAFTARGKTLGKNISVVGFDDGFSDFDPGSMIGGFVTGSILANASHSSQDAPVVSTVFVPSRFIANQINKFATTHGTVIGTPRVHAHVQSVFPNVILETCFYTREKVLFVVIA